MVNQLSKCLTLLLSMTLFLSSNAWAQNEVINFDFDEGTSAIGQWIKDGPPIKEYPVCYQLWKCESSRPMSGESISLPKGEWGLCDNYAERTSNNICTKCDAPPPIEVCE